MNIFFDLIKMGGLPSFGNPMSGFLYYFTGIIGLLFCLVYFHQMIYMIVGSLKTAKIKPKGPVTPHKIGIVISARNESKVLPNLINSIRANDYPQELVNIFIVADNCTDDTAAICREMGCIVFERFDEQHIGKGYALNYLFTKLHTEEEYAQFIPEAYIIVDADNVLKSNYITEMNKAFSCGYEFITSYRNSKNFSKNWITSGYGFWFLHEARHLNNARMIFNTSCSIQGTGFLIATQTVKDFDNWHFFTLTEDVQCSTEYVLKGKKIAYCHAAEFYDEQPTTFKQSWKQRERWAKGFYQVFALRGWSLIKSAFTNFSSWDNLTTIFPAIFISIITLLVLPICAVICLCTGDIANLWQTLYAALWAFIPMLGGTYMMGLLLCITEWKKILANPVKKILYTFTFPLFMASYIPICIVALFKKVKWTPIEHTESISLEQLEEEEKIQELSLEEQIKIMQQKEEEKKKNKRDSA